jgi:hypothetical protein
LVDSIEDVVSGQRADSHRLLGGITDGQRLHFLDKRLEELVGDRFVDDDPLDVTN